MNGPNPLFLEYYVVNRLLVNLVWHIILFMYAVAAEDVGLNVIDLDTVHMFSRYTTCISEEKGGSGNPSVATGKGELYFSSRFWIGVKHATVYVPIFVSVALCSKRSWCKTYSLVYILIIIMDTYIAPVSTKFDAHGAWTLLPPVIGPVISFLEPSQLHGIQAPQLGFDWLGFEPTFWWLGHQNTSPMHWTARPRHPMDIIMRDSRSHQYTLIRVGSALSLSLTLLSLP